MGYDVFSRGNKSPRRGIADCRRARPGLRFQDGSGVVIAVYLPSLAILMATHLESQSPA